MTSTTYRKLTAALFLVLASALMLTSSASASSSSSLKGPFVGIATTYDPSLGGINGREASGSFTPSTSLGYAVAKLGNSSNIAGWSFPADNRSYHGWLLRITNLANNRSIDVPVSDIGPGVLAPPSRDSLARSFSPSGSLPRVLDLLPNVSRQLTGGAPQNIKVQFTPLRKLSQAETARYSRGQTTATAVVRR